MNDGKLMYQWVSDLFPLNRSLTGDGVRETLRYIKNIIPELSIHEIPSGTQCFDWTVPKEWNCTKGYIITPQGEKICDFSVNNLHVIGYSIPVDDELEYEDLIPHLHHLKNQPDAIPYITSYYKEQWGFCITYNELQRLTKGTYKVVIDSVLKDGFLTYGEVLITGDTASEVFLSTYICHPSMANNELSRPAVAMALTKLVKDMPKRKHSYRIIFIPETIGSICYLSKHLATMKKNIVAGFNLTTIGDDLAYSFIPTKYGNTIADKIAKHVLQDTDYHEYTFLDRGSDERQYCSPMVDLPVATICRSKYGEYPEYHTSLDNLNLVSPAGLFGGYDKLRQAILLLEHNERYKVTVHCEPQLGKRGLYPTLSVKGGQNHVRTMMNFITYADGTNDLVDIANIIGVRCEDLYDLIHTLTEEGLISTVS